MKKQEYPHCFGVLEIVFPKGEDGFRSTPEHCFVCFCKTACLKTAMEKSDGMKVQEEVIDRAYHSGMMGFLERWSKKKSIHRKINEKK